MTDLARVRKAAAGLLGPAPKKTRIQPKDWPIALGFAAAAAKAGAGPALRELQKAAPRLMRSHPACAAPPAGKGLSLCEAAGLAAALQWALKRQKGKKSFQDAGRMAGPAVSALTGLPGGPAALLLPHPAEPHVLQAAAARHQAVLLYSQRPGRPMPEALSTLQQRTDKAAHRAAWLEAPGLQIAVYDAQGTAGGEAKPRPAPRRVFRSIQALEDHCAGKTREKPAESAWLRIPAKPAPAISAEDDGEEIYVPWQPLLCFGGKLPPHPTALLEPRATAGGNLQTLPDHVLLPAKAIKAGALSDAQGETLAFIQQAFREMLPACGGLPERRKGFLLGDGTGAGKGRILAATLAMGLQNGGTRAVWFSPTPALFPDAERDWRDTGGDPEQIRMLPGGLGAKSLPAGPALLFAPYSRIRKPEQLKALIEWLKESPESPVLAFDESHTLGTSIQKKATVQWAKPGEAPETLEAGDASSKQGQACMAIQDALPAARILYASGTAFTSPASFAYASRLGLWASPFTCFSTREEFLMRVLPEGNRALEIVAREARRNGTLHIRCVDHRAVAKEPLKAALSPDQTRTQNLWAKAWRLIARENRELLEQEFSGPDSGIPRNKLLGIRREFFRHMINAFKTDAVIEAIRKDLAAGRAPVVQVESTMEASLRTALQKHAEEEGEGVPIGPDTDLSARARAQELVASCFPVQETEMVEVSPGEWKEQPRMGPDGRPKIRAAALLAREKAINAMERHPLPPFILDQLVWEFGDQLAEVSGRSVRTRLDRAAGKRIAESRKPADSLREAEEFQKGKRRILVFTRSGSTGRSYHDQPAPGKKSRPRTHYVVQMPERKEALIQGLGRSHRTGQASAPKLVFVTTNLPGERRFLSSAAANLEMMGAGCRGDTQAFEEKMLGENAALEEACGAAALEELYQDLVRGQGAIGNRYPGMDFFRQTGIDPEKRLKQGIGPSEVRIFLNRMLALPVKEQEFLIQELDQAIRDVKESGNYRPSRAERIQTKGARAQGEARLPGRTRLARPLLRAFTLPEAHEFPGSQTASTAMLDAFAGQKNRLSQGIARNAGGTEEGDWWHDESRVWFRIPGTGVLLEGHAKGAAIRTPAAWTRDGNPVLKGGKTPVSALQARKSQAAQLRARRACRKAAEGAKHQLLLFCDTILPVWPFAPGGGRSSWLPVAGEAPEFGLACSLPEAVHALRDYARALSPEWMENS